MDSWIETLKTIDWQLLALTWGAKILGGLLILVIGLWLAKWLSHVAERAMTRHKMEPTAVQFLRKVAYVILLVLLVVAVLRMFHVPMGSMLAVLGAAGLAIGLALKDSLSNIASGVMLVSLKPFKAGDLVNINNETGTVESVSIFQTVLRGADNQTIILPNALVTGDSIINLTPGVMRRVELVIGIGYTDDIDAARDTALELMRSEPRVLAEPAPSVVVYALGDNAVSLGIRCHTNNDDNFSTKCDLTERIKKAFDQAGIGMPYPQRDVHLYHHDARDGDVIDPRTLNAPPGGLAEDA